MKLLDEDLEEAVRVMIQLHLWKFADRPRLVERLVQTRRFDLCMQVAKDNEELQLNIIAHCKESGNLRILPVLVEVRDVCVDGCC